MISLQSYASNASTIPRSIQDLDSTDDLALDIEAFNTHELKKSEPIMPVATIVTNKKFFFKDIKNLRFLNI